MEINNLEIIKHFLNFNSPDEFYYLQILKRRKENPKLGSNSHVIKTYYITSIDYLELKMSEIISLCKLHNARAYINLTSRSFERIAFHTLKKVTDCILNKDYKSIRKAYESVCGEYGSGEKYWVIDIDDHNLRKVEMIATIINRLQSSYSCNTVAYIPTINGWHLITHPFNLGDFEVYRVENSIDVHKNNPTILYYNNDKTN